MFPIISLCKICDPPGVPFLAILNKLGRGLLDDATYQISRLKALWFQIRIFYHAVPMLAFVKYVTPGAGQF